MVKGEVTAPTAPVPKEIQKVRKAPAKAPKAAANKELKPVKLPEMKLFGRWSTAGIQVKDAGIKDYINLDPRLVPKVYSRFMAKRQFYKSKSSIVERLINHLFVVGHKGKKHKLTSGRNVGKTGHAISAVIKGFEIIEGQTKINPVEVLVRAIENSAPLEEVISYQRGGIFVREAVVTAPQRRVDLALRHITQGTYKKSFASKKTAAQALADEIIAAYKKDSAGSYAVSEKNRREREATESR